MIESEPGEAKRVNSYIISVLKIMTDWKELEPDTPKISQDMREIQKTAQDYGNRLIHIPMKIETLSETVDKIFKILPDLHKDLRDLKTEVTNLKTNQKENPETSRSKKERTRDVLGSVPFLNQKGKVMETLKPKTRDDMILEAIKSIK